MSEQLWKLTYDQNDYVTKEYIYTKYVILSAKTETEAKAIFQRLSGTWAYLQKIEKYGE